jgi:hypothetical protein
MSLIVLIPLAALFLKTTELTLERFVRPFRKEYRDALAQRNAEWTLAQKYRAPLERTLQGVLLEISTIRESWCRQNVPEGCTPDVPEMLWLALPVSLGEKR